MLQLQKMTYLFAGLVFCMGLLSAALFNPMSEHATTESYSIQGAGLIRVKSAVQAVGDGIAREWDSIRAVPAELRTSQHETRQLTDNSLRFYADRSLQTSSLAYYTAKAGNGLAADTPYPDQIGANDTLVTLTLMGRAE